MTTPAPLSRTARLVERRMTGSSDLRNSVTGVLIDIGYVFLIVLLLVRSVVHRHSTSSPHGSF